MHSKQFATLQVLAALLKLHPYVCIGFTPCRKLLFVTTIQIKMRPLSIVGAVLIFVFCCIIFRQNIQIYNVLTVTMDGTRTLAILKSFRCRYHHPQLQILFLLL